jgi:hypothetical protein
MWGFSLGSPFFGRRHADSTPCDTLSLKLNKWGSNKRLQSCVVTVRLSRGVGFKKT